MNWIDYSQRQPLEKNVYVLTVRILGNPYSTSTLALGFYDTDTSVWYKFNPYEPFNFTDLSMNEQLVSTTIVGWIDNLGIYGGSSHT